MTPDLVTVHEPGPITLIEVLGDDPSITAAEIEVEPQISLIEIEVPGFQGPGPDDYATAMIMMALADLDNKIVFFGGSDPNGEERVADSLETLDGIDLVNSVNLDTSVPGEIKPGIGLPQLIPSNAGTVIGDMTGNGGIGAAFDGVWPKTTAQSAFTAGVSGYVGKIFPAPRKISSIVVKAASDYGYDGSPAAGRSSLTAYGTLGSAPAVLLGAVPSVSDTPSGAATIDPSLAAYYDRVDIVMGSQFGGCCIAQGEIYEAGAVAPATILAKPRVLSFVPKKMRCVFIVDDIAGLALDTDIKASFSRAESVWTAAPLSKRYDVPDSTRSVLVTEEVGLVGQPSGNTPLWRLQTFGAAPKLQAYNRYCKG